ncbi:hypothetical protein EXN66_Car013920 [Channa argus]|uniref:Uncharacterized protein n=1 Tax=Channa argus TaxID=215402 RepID=A0A6G1Q735_CHAAH|nr:hypothetical protein EXN66_Car013920 [Channa argus]
MIPRKLHFTIVLSLVFIAVVTLNSQDKPKGQKLKNPLYYRRNCVVQEVQWVECVCIYVYIVCVHLTFIKTIRHEDSCSKDWEETQHVVMSVYRVTVMTESLSTDVYSMSFISGSVLILFIVQLLLSVVVLLPVLLPVTFYYTNVIICQHWLIHWDLCVTLFFGIASLYSFIYIDCKMSSLHKVLDVQHLCVVNAECAL